MPSDFSWETRNFIGGKILDPIFDNWNERFAKLQQDYKSTGKAMLEINMAIEVPECMCTYMWGGITEELEVEVELERVQGSEEGGNANPVRGESNLHVEARALMTRGKERDDVDLCSGALASTVSQSRNADIEAVARPTSKSSKGNSNLHGGVLTSTAPESPNLDIEAVVWPAPNSSKGNSNLHIGVIASTAQNTRNSNIAPNVRPAPKIVQNNSNIHCGVPTSTEPQNRNSNVAPTTRLAPNSNTHKAAIPPKNQRPANNQNTAPGRTHKSSSSARTTQNLPVPTTARSLLSFDVALYSDPHSRERDRQRFFQYDIEDNSRQQGRRRHSGESSGASASARGGMGGNSGARGGSKRSRDDREMGDEPRKHARRDYASRRD
ncbi:hypothetical protein BOTCAL_0262g00010 [Botryotinia calthae]|uniref:Uncharacterized protein n=1 Tax=Botryotinia calthae TaxID=38488 RepID=A0A4Y8CYN3_9HELO|nr:hypothetical protein BOTCAL_0262g00010 [Botryotinia calthae]